MSKVHSNKSEKLANNGTPNTTSDGHEDTPSPSIKKPRSSSNAENDTDKNGVGDAERDVERPATSDAAAIEHTEFEVCWDEPIDQDHANPQNWSTARKWSIIATIYHQLPHISRLSRSNRHTLPVTSTDRHSIDILRLPCLRPGCPLSWRTSAPAPRFSPALSYRSLCWASSLVPSSLPLPASSFADR